MGEIKSKSINVEITNRFKDIFGPLVKSNRFLYRFFDWLLYNRKSVKPFGLLYKPEDINHSYYDKIKNLGDRELEHQIGRLSNYKDIVAASTNLKGDFIEFGTWKGFSLLWISYFMDRNAIFDRKVFGLDGFIGLPYSDGVFNRFAFSNTSLKMCRGNIYNSQDLSDKIKGNIFIDQFLYNQKKEILTYFKKNQVKKFCFIHIDCDVSRSAKEIFELLDRGNLIADKCFILFDDYGCESKLKETVDSIFKKMKNSWKIGIHSGTELTKNFYLERKK